MHNLFAPFKQLLSEGGLYSTKKYKLLQVRVVIDRYLTDLN